MDPRDPTQRPSIFNSPDPTDLPSTPKLPPPRQPYERPMPRRPSEPLHETAEDPGPSRRVLIALGAGGLLVLVLGGFVAASLLRPADDPPVAAASETPAPSASATLPASPTVTPSATPSEAPTPSPTPAGPPQELAVGSWASVSVDELNVRSAPDMGAVSTNLLVRGAVVHVAEGPSVVAGLNWYRLASLGGATGWATSGWVEEPFMATLVDDPTLIRCGEVRRSVFDIMNGAPVPHEPLAIGDLALPVAAFSDAALGTMELLRGVGEEACFTAQVGASGLPVVTGQLTVSACGRAVRDGAFFRLRPATGQQVPPQYQVKDPVVLHPALLTSAVEGDPMAANLRIVTELIAARDDTSGCFYANANGDAETVEASMSISTSQCFVAYEHGTDGITLGAAAGGDSKRLLTSPGSTPPFSFALNTPVFLHVSADTSSGGSNAWVYQGYDESCA